MTNTDAMSAPGRLVYITLPGVDLYVYRSRSTCFVVLDLDLVLSLSLELYHQLLKGRFTQIRSTLDLDLTFR